MGGGWILAGTNTREAGPVLLNEGKGVSDGNSESQSEDEGEGAGKGENESGGGDDVERPRVGTRMRAREWDQ